jgi:hypothetical protein
MKNSAQKIRTSHVGRLPIPQGFEQTALRLTRGEVGGEEVVAQVVPVVADAVKRQVGIGLDCIGDGEYWSALDIKWFDQQMTGLSTRLLKPGEIGSIRESTRERDVFHTLYADMDRVGTIACIPGERPRPPTRERIIVNGPIKSRGTAATQRQLDCFKAAIARSGVALDEAFVPALAPGWLMPRLNSAPDGGHPQHAGNGFLMRRGFTVVWSGSQGDVPPGADRLTARFPIIPGITGRVREEFIAENTGLLGDSNIQELSEEHFVGTLVYPVADPDGATLTVRQREGDPRVAPAGLAWRLADDRHVEITRPSEPGFDRGAIYEFIYRARDPIVMGIGFAAIRDIVSYRGTKQKTIRWRRRSARASGTR